IAAPRGACDLRGISGRPCRGSRLGGQLGVALGWAHGQERAEAAMNGQWRTGLVLAAFLAMAVPSAAWAQAHDHGPAQKVIQVAPRAEFRNANHEGVLVHENGRLILYLHRFSDGNPLSGAEV